MNLRSRTVEIAHVAGLAGTLGGTQEPQMVFRGAKAIRSQTKIGENSVSLGSLTVTIAEKLFAQLSTCRVMLIGAGELAQLVGKHLKSAGISQFTIAKRSKTRGDELAKLLGGKSISLDTANTSKNRHFSSFNIIFFACYREGSVEVL